MKKKISDTILGISDSHDCGATVVKKNKILCSINEERIIRKKNCHGFPKQSILTALKVSKLKVEDIKVVAFAGISRVDKNISTFNNLMNDQKKFGFILNLISFLSKNIFFRIFFRSNFFLFLLRDVIYKIFFFKRKRKILKNLKEIRIFPKEIFFYDHHDCHMFSAFSLSPFKESLVISNDGMGDGLCSKVNYIKNNNSKNISSNSFYNSLGLIYGYCSDLCGYKKIYHNGKTTGLAMLGNGKKVEEELNKIILFNERKGIYFNTSSVFRGTYFKIKKKFKN